MALSLQGTLFMQSWKDFVDGKLAESQKMYPLLTFNFPEINLMLNHSRIHELVNFLVHIKEKASQMNIQRNKILEIDALLAKIQQKQSAKINISFEGLINEARELIKQKKDKQALQKFREAIKIKPSEQAYISIGIIELYLNKNMKGFIDNINIALNFNEDKANLSLYERSIDNLSSYQKEIIISFKCLRRVLALQSNNPKYYLQFVQLGFKINQNLSQYLGKIQTNCPQSIQKYISLGIIYYTLDKQQKCLDNFDKAQIKIKLYLKQKKLAQLQYKNTKNPNIFSKLATFNKIDQFYYYIGKAYQKYPFHSSILPIEVFQIGLKYNNKNLDIWKQILQIFQSKSNYQSQLFDFVEQIIEFAQDDFQIHKMIIDLLFEIGQTELLMLTAQSLLTQYQYNDKYLYLAANSYFKTNNYTKCKQLCSKCIKTNAKNQEVYLLIGLVLFQQKKYEQAKANYEKAIILNPNQYLAYYNLAIVLYNSAQYEQAKKQCQNAIQKKPYFFQSYYLLINTYLKNGKNDEADQKIEQLLQKSKQNYEAIYCLAQVKFQREKFGDAQEYYQNVLKKKPNHFQSIYKLAIIKAILQKDKQNLNSILEKAQYLIKQDMNKIKYISLLGYVQTKSGKFEEAYQTLMSGINKHKDYYQTYFHLGSLFKLNQQISIRHGDDAQNLIQTNLEDVQSFYYASLFYLALENYQTFIAKFNSYLNFYKQKILDNPKQSKKMKVVYRNIISDCEELIKFYPQSIDLSFILGILYRDIGITNKSLYFCKKLVKNQQLLSNNFINFYNINYKYHEETNYLQLIYEFVFHQIFQFNTLEGMKFYSFLKNSKNVFFKNQAINHAITKRKQRIASKKILQVVVHVHSVFQQIKQTYTQDLSKQSSRSLNKIRNILNILNEDQQIINYEKLEDILYLIVESKQIGQTQQFAPLVVLKKEISSLLYYDFKGQFIQRYKCQIVRLLVLKYYYIQLYPFVYQNQKRSSLSELITKFPYYTEFQSSSDHINKIRMFVQSKLAQNDVVKKDFPSIFSSQILFDQFQAEENIVPLLQAKKRIIKRQKILKEFDLTTRKLTRYQGLNTLQKKVIKQQPKHRSLIQFHKKSSLFIPKNSSSIFSIDQQPFQ